MPETETRIDKPRFKISSQHILDFSTGVVILIAICGGLGIGLGIETV